MILSVYDQQSLRKRLQSRVTRESGIGSGSDNSLLGRKKTLILGIVPDTKETYKNIQLDYDMIGVNQLS